MGLSVHRIDLSLTFPSSLPLQVLWPPGIAKRPVSCPWRCLAQNCSHPLRSWSNRRSKPWWWTGNSPEPCRCRYGLLSAIGNGISRSRRLNFYDIQNSDLDGPDATLARPATCWHTWPFFHPREFCRALLLVAHRLGKDCSSNFSPRYTTLPNRGRSSGLLPEMSRSESPKSRPIRTHDCLKKKFQISVCKFACSVG